MQGLRRVPRLIDSLHLIAERERQQAERVEAEVELGSPLDPGCRLRRNHRRPRPDRRGRGVVALMEPCARRGVAVAGNRCDRVTAMLKGKRILLIVAGGIAAFKSQELVRLLRKRDASVRCVLTEAGAKFVTPLALQALTEDKVYTDLFSLTDESEMGHIQLSRDADLLVVAPATANILARMAAGLADDLATTVLLATDKPVLAAPAMNVRMWTHAATVANVETLRKRGIHFVGPNDGVMACNEYGPGRMSEPEEIVAAIEGLLAPRPREAAAPASARW